MNRSHNFYFGEMNNIIGVHTPPASLELKIKTLRLAIARMEPVEFDGKEQSLTAKRAELAMLEQMQLAHDIADKARADLMVRYPIAVLIAESLNVDTSDAAGYARLMDAVVNYDGEE